MKVFKCGTLVTLKLLTIQGMITAVEIRFERAVYEISYVMNKEMCKSWMDENEFNVDEGACKNNIGY